MRSSKFVVAALLLATSLGASAQVTTFAGVLLSLENLKSALQSTIGTVDAETAARIRQAQIAIDQTIDKVRAAVAEAGAMTDNIRDRVMGDVYNTLDKTNELIQSTSNNAFENVNNSLANSYKLAAAVPFAGTIPTSIHVVRPYSIYKEASNAPVTVQVQGYFPDVSKEHPAYVVVGAGQRKPLLEFVNNTLEFDLPASALPPEEQFVRMQFVLPVKKLWGVYYSEVVLNAKVYVRRAKPFDVSYSVQTENPAIWSAVVSPRLYKVSANSEQTSNIATVTAASLFSTLVGDNTNYDMATATLASWSKDQRAAITDNVNPCESGCTASTGSWSWSPGTLSFDLKAPSCAFHKIARSGLLEVSYTCGGGTHADFANTPTFRVRNRQNLPVEVTAASGTMSLARATVAPPVPLPAGWTSVDVSTRYRDGSVSNEASTRLTPGAAGKLNFNAANWSTDIKGTNLSVMTR